MTILLVDDERVTLEAIRSSIDWAALDVDCVLEAQDAASARSLCLEQNIRLMLCDIEMPGESGLELVRWAKLHCPDMLCLLLTGHAEFDYARQAVELGAFEYLLKPVAMEQLAQALRRAVDELRRRAGLRQRGLQWEKNQDAVVEQFWTQLMLGRLPRGQKELEQCAVRRSLDIPLGRPYRLLLCAVRRLQGALTAFQAMELDYAFKNMLTEIFTTGEVSAQVLGISPRHKVVLADAGLSNGEVTRRCGEFFGALQQYFKANACFYVAAPCLPAEMGEAYGSLSRWEAQNVAYENRVFFAEVQGVRPSGLTPERMQHWTRLLLNDCPEELTAELLERLEEAMACGDMNREALVALYNDVLQVLGAALGEHGVSTGQAMERLGGRVEQAFSSVEEMRALLRDMVRFSADVLEQTRSGETLADKVRQYIREHIREDLPRDKLAAVVYVNPSYLSRVFRAQTGVSLVDYVTGEKIQRIQQLLRTTNRSVSDIALEFGYTNMPYFSQVFKKSVGCSPLEYRRSR